MTPCGQTRTHLPHWMQSASSHTGISSAMLRFSHCAVPVGKVPSMGMALTGQIVAFAGDDCAGDSLHELGRGGRTPADGMSNSAGDLAGDLDFVQMAEGCIHRREILLHDAFAALAVGLLDDVLDGGDGLFARQHAADGEEAGLHDGVDAAAHAGLLGDFVAVDHVELRASCR